MVQVSRKFGGVTSVQAPASLEETTFWKYSSNVGCWSFKLSGANPFTVSFNTTKSCNGFSFFKLPRKKRRRDNLTFCSIFWLHLRARASWTLSSTVPNEVALLVSWRPKSGGEKSKANSSEGTETSFGRKI